MTGFHPATIRKWLKQGPPVKIDVPDERRVLTSKWRFAFQGGVRVSRSVQLGLPA